MGRNPTMAVIAACAVLIAGGHSAHSQQSVADFYRGKQIRVIISAAPATDYDMFARLIAAQMTKTLPGNPTFLHQNMPGAGGIIATNNLYNIAPKDGTVIGMVNRNMPHVALTKMANVQFDPVKFNWLGSPEVVAFGVRGADRRTGAEGRGPVPARALDRRRRLGLGTEHHVESSRQPARHEVQAGRGLQERPRRLARHDAQGGARRLPVAQRTAGRQPRGMDRGRQAQGAVQPRTEAARRASRPFAPSSNLPRPTSSARSSISTLQPRSWAGRC